MAFSSNLRGALFMAISMAVFSVNDTITKAVTESMNLGQILLIRGLFASLIVGLTAWRFDALRALRDVIHPMVGLRIIGEAGATACFLAALAHMPLGNASAVMQALPLAVTMGAALFIGEPVGWRRWTAISAGFVGVLIVVRPGLAGFNAYSLFALTSVMFCTLRDLATRSVPAKIPSLLISTVTAVAVTIFGGFLVIPFGGWSPLTIVDTMLLFAAAILLAIGYQTIILSLREGDISFIAPFRYMALLWSIFFGFLVFGDIPDIAMIAGSAVIVGSGLYSLYREQIVGRRVPIAESVTPAMAPDGT